MFYDRERVADINGVASFFKRVNYPAQALHADTKTYLDTFFGTGAFVTLCDKIFGPSGDYLFHDADSLCWMDVANRSPNGSVATALYNLVAPQAPLVVLLEAFSEPLVTFSNRINTGWKSTEGQQELFNRYQIDLPLSAIYDNSFKLLSEDPEADLYTFSRARCPPVLFIPFWDPPLMTRKEFSQNSVMTSMPCSPLAYFVWRLFLYASRRASTRGQRILMHRRLNSLGAWIRATEEIVADLFSEGRLPTEFPFYDKVLSAFTQRYVGPDLEARLRGQRLLEDVMWTRGATIGALLLFAPFVLAHRTITQPLRESSRSPVYDSSLLAQIVVTVPYLTRAYLTLNSLVDTSSIGRFGVPAVTHAPLVGDEFPNDELSPAANDILNVRRAFYRNCLVTLRECTLSLEGFANCKSIHFNNTLELWLSLMNPRNDPDGHVERRYAMHHPETYTFLTESALKMMERSTFMASLDIVGASLLQRCLSVLAAPEAAHILDAVEQATTQSNELVNTLTSSFVLDWEDDTGAIGVVNVRGADCCDYAAHVYVMMERMLAKGEISDEMQRMVAESMRLLDVVFPSASLFFDKWRMPGSSAVHAPAVAAPQFESHQKDTDLMTEEEKTRFFNGMMALRRFPSRIMKLPTNNGRIPGGHHPALTASLKNEIPLLIGITRFLDALIAKSMEGYYSTWIPKCESGHNLWLLHSSNYSCSHHPAEVAIWECGICEKVYGVCCQSSPLTASGAKLQCTRADSIGSHYCSDCGELFPARSVVYFCTTPETILCPDCASRPFRPVSVRWLASYTTWAVVLTAFMIYIFFRVFLF